MGKVKLSEVYRVALKENYIALFPHCDIKGIENHTYSTPKYGWVIQPEGYGVIERPDLPQLGIKAKYPLEVGDITLSSRAHVVEITHVIKTDQDLTAFRIDAILQLAAQSRNESERLNDKYYAMTGKYLPR